MYFMWLRKVSDIEQSHPDLYFPLEHKESSRRLLAFTNPNTTMSLYSATEVHIFEVCLHNKEHENKVENS